MTPPVPTPFAAITSWLQRERVPLSPGDPLWEAVADRLIAEGLAGVALSLLAREESSARPAAAILGRLSAELNRVRSAQVILFDRFEKLAACLEAAGVEFIVHKGGALAPLVYTRAEDRPMVDIDILFRPGDWRRVRDALVAAGYRLPAGADQQFWLENYFNLSVASPADPPAHFDLHWSLTQEGRYHIETEDLFAGKVRYALGPLSLHRLANEELLLSLFLHLAYHYFEARLLWLYDMTRVMRALPPDWARLESLATRWGLRSVVAFNLDYLERVFPGEIPAGARGRFRPGGIRRALVAPLRSSAPGHLFRGEERRMNQFLIGLLAIDRPADAARFAGDKVRRTLRWLGRRPRRR